MIISEILLVKESLTEKITNLKDITCFLSEQNKESDKGKMIPNLWKLVRLLNLFPATSAEAERSFSKMRLLKNHLRNSMTTEGSTI